MIRKATGEAGSTGTNISVWDLSVKTVSGTSFPIPLFHQSPLFVKHLLMTEGMMPGISQKYASWQNNTLDCSPGTGGKQELIDAKSANAITGSAEMLPVKVMSVGFHYRSFSRADCNTFKNNCSVETGMN